MIRDYEDVVGVDVNEDNVTIATNQGFVKFETRGRVRTAYFLKRRKIQTKIGCERVKAEISVTRVLWALLCSEDKTPIAISLKLRTSQSAIVKHLDKLGAIGLVKRGEKAGRFQHYEVNWDKAHELLLHETPTFGFILEAGIRKELTDKLLANERFKSLVRGYFTALAEIVDEQGELYGPSPGPTIGDAIRGFGV